MRVWHTYGVIDMSSDEGKQQSPTKLAAAGLVPDSDQDTKSKMTMKMNVDEPPAADAGASGVETSDALGRHLKKVYGKLLSEPVPDRFFELLRRLEQHPTPAKKTDDGRETE